SDSPSRRTSPRRCRSSPAMTRVTSPARRCQSAVVSPWRDLSSDLCVPSAGFRSGRGSGSVKLRTSVMTTLGVNAFGVGRGSQKYDAMVELAREAEASGCAAIWTSELYNRSATIPMAAVAAGTSTIQIGSNIAYGVGRTPLIWAAEARDLDELSDGRIILGLGNGTPKMMEAWHGVNGEAPAARMSELLQVMKKLW